MSVVSYIVTGIRVLTPTPKVAAKNPDRFVTVVGTAFHKAEPDAKGKLQPVERLSYTSKAITHEMALADGFNIDLANGVLTLSEGQRGRRASAGLSQADILASLNALRNPEPEPEPEA
jgi:hypothetical protein